MRWSRPSRTVPGPDPMSSIDRIPSLFHAFSLFSLSFFLFFEMYRPACRTVHFVFVSGCRKTCSAEGLGGKKRGKGNRQGVLSRQITRRSGKIAKQYYKKFCNFEGSLAKDPKGLFDKLTVRLAGRYISFLRNGLAKKLPSRRFRREDKGKTSGYPRYGKEPPLCHSEERSDVGISGKMFRIRRDFPEIQNSPARLPRPLRGLAMTRLGHLTSREPSGSLRLSKSLRFAE